MGTGAVDYEVWTKEAMRVAGGSGMALMDNKANLVAFEGEPSVRASPLFPCRRKR